MAIEFPVFTQKKSVKIARWILRVKHNHKYAILDIKQISERGYYNLSNENK